MAVFYTLTWRGTIGALNWAVVTHWQRISSIVGATPLQEAQALCAGAVDTWNTNVKPICWASTNLTKVQAKSSEDPEGFAELTTAIAGAVTGDASPPFVSKGFRQFRSNTLFRTSSHRFPDVMEANNVSGSWAYDAAITAPKIAAVATMLGSTLYGNIPVTLDTLGFRPVLIRRQYTTIDPITHDKTITYLNPPEISPVANAAFYGITSQVSRKFVLPS